ncbi:hypothetical protein H5410_057523 [Solanum commersonii]|uniref:Uncharacterized protein n=1 Tax=Solanum commersonii TaxID=4109 RepID=A0A9J5WPZ3_SOLCO|nr:hypothetical protein H5410_057523 [Solanum commersonii]
MPLTSLDQIYNPIEYPSWAELRFKRLRDPAIMANQSSKKRKSEKEVHASSKAKDAKTPKKRGRKVAPPILRPTLPVGDGMELFKDTIFAPYLNMPKCN